MASVSPFATGLTPHLYYLGRLCKRGHDEDGAGHSLRLRVNRTCAICERERQALTAEARGKAAFAQRIALVNKIKLERGCADCGYAAHAAALHFDHLPGSIKRRGVAQLCNNTPIAAVLEEIAKCEVVCANCHAIRTWNRRRESEQPVHPLPPRYRHGPAHG